MVDEKKEKKIAEDLTKDEMPSVTNLLRRKKFSGTDPSKQKGVVPPAPPIAAAPSAPVVPPAPAPWVGAHMKKKPPEPSKPEAPIELVVPTSAIEEELVIEKKESPAAASAPTVSESGAPFVQPIARRGTRKPVPDLIVWEKAQMDSGSDPLGKAVVTLLKKGASSGLFLATESGVKPGTGARFTATAAFGIGIKTGLWTGLCWDSAIVPEVWAHFLKDDFMEFSPPGTVTNLASVRNVVRAAFGANKDEWATIIRVGSAQACRGMLMMISPNSIKEAIASVLPLLSGPAPQKKAG